MLEILERCNCTWNCIPNKLHSSDFWYGHFSGVYGRFYRWQSRDFINRTCGRHVYIVCINRIGRKSDFGDPESASCLNLRHKWNITVQISVFASQWRVLCGLVGMCWVSVVWYQHKRLVSWNDSTVNDVGQDHRDIKEMSETMVSLGLILNQFLFSELFWYRLLPETRTTKSATSHPKYTRKARSIQNTNQLKRHLHYHKYICQNTRNIL